MIGTRPLGRTGLDISPLALGTGGMAANGTEGAGDAFAHALAAGVNAVELAVDDAAAVAFVAGLIRRERAGHLHVLVRAAPLVPLDLPSPHLVADQVYPGQALRAQVEGLLRALGVERLALLHLHAWSPEWLGEGDWLDTLERLRAEGKITGFGPSLFDHDAAAGVPAASLSAIASVQAMHNIFDPAAAASLLPGCASRQVAVIARAPFHFGALAAPPAADARWGDWRDVYFHAPFRDEVAERAGRIARRAEEHGETLAGAALRFAMFAPGVTSVAAGLRTRDHVQIALDATARGPLSPAFLAALEAERWLC